MSQSNPNGATQPVATPVIRLVRMHRDRRGTGGTETSQYPEEETSTRGRDLQKMRPEIPVVVASEPGRAQTSAPSQEGKLGL